MESEEHRSQVKIACPAKLAALISDPTSTDSSETSLQSGTEIHPLERLKRQAGKSQKIFSKYGDLTKSYVKSHVNATKRKQEKKKMERYRAFVSKQEKLMQRTRTKVEQEVQKKAMRDKIQVDLAILRQGKAREELFPAVERVEQMHLKGKRRKKLAIFNTFDATVYKKVVSNIKKQLWKAAKLHSEGSDLARMSTMTGLTGRLDLISFSQVASSSSFVSDCCPRMVSSYKLWHGSSRKQEDKGWASWKQSAVSELNELDLPTSDPARTTFELAPCIPLSKRYFSDKKQAGVDRSKMRETLEPENWEPNKIADSTLNHFNKGNRKQRFKNRKIYSELCFNDFAFINGKEDCIDNCKQNTHDKELFPKRKRTDFRYLLQEEY